MHYGFVFFYYSMMIWLYAMRLYDNITIQMLIITSYLYIFQNIQFYRLHIHEPKPIYSLESFYLPTNNFLNCLKKNDLINVKKFQSRTEFYNYNYNQF